MCLSTYFASALSSLIFKMCIQRDPYNWSEPMYELYTHSILNYLLTRVQPALQTAHGQYDVAFLKEWKTRWANQKLIVQGLAKLFMYLDRFYTPVSHTNTTRPHGATLSAPLLRVWDEMHLSPFDRLCEHE